MLHKIERVHLIGIGGIGVSAVARVLMARGFKVSGSDVRESQLTTALRNEGATVTIGHSADLVDGVDLVIYSTAIPATNPELVSARAKGVKVEHRARILGALLETLNSVGIIGTHGKGTVSAMTTACLEAAGRDPSFIIGGLLLDYGLNARVTDSQDVVVEIDESDGSLVHVRPRTLVVNNIEADHLNYYKNLEGVYAKVQAVLEADEGRERAIMHVGDPGVRELMRRIDKDISTLTVGFDTDLEGSEAEVIGSNLDVGTHGSRFDVTQNGTLLGSLSMPQPGRYNAMNALVACGAALSLGITFEAIQKGLGQYSGLENRFTVVDAGNIRVVKDYISHPTGIRRVLEAARTLSDGPITAVFKPYRFTMIHYLGDEYAVAFRDADKTIITELYTAGEVPIAGVDTDWLISKIRSTGTPVTYIQEMDDIVGHLVETVQPGQQVIFFGGDDLFQLADAFIARVGE
ncbi:MAG: UDP-N-acetylmuramate--alanine ligase [Myxococcota bacterium]|jgi:UDP-N-acetylmuramate--alanine ligase